MASQSLYRKWRSQTFSDLIGQEAITRTLLNAVREGRLAHAYLFCGPRGTGKTSTARLLAKAVNCAKPHNGEPCNECLSCREITAGRSPDVIEIDAASNTGVDNIRDLRENVSLLGTGGHYRVFVVDEVHMLSTAAFNALLKTLEEPPPHVIFVLATTEAQKVLPTVVSRCQRFDFRRITSRDIVARLNHVAQGEGLDLEPAAAELLARAAQGGLRDAVSLLDQAMAYCGARIDLARTREMLGLSDTETLRTIVRAVAEERAADGLEAINSLVTAGADLRQVQQQLAEEWRALMLARTGSDLARLIDCSVEEARELTDLAQRFSLDELMACARVFARNETPARGLPVPQLALELAFLECVAIHQGRGYSAQPSVAVATTPAITPPRAAISQPAPLPEPQPLRAPNPRTAALAKTAPVADEPDLAAFEPGEDLPSAADTSGPALRLVPSRATTVVPEHEDTPDLEDEPSAPEPTASVAPRAWDTGQPAETGALINRVRQEWLMIRKVCKQKSPKVAALLNNAQPTRVDAGSPPVLVLHASHSFHFTSLRKPESVEVVEWAVEQVIEQPIRVRFELANGSGEGGKGAPARGGTSQPLGGQAARGPNASGSNLRGYGSDAETRGATPPQGTAIREARGAVAPQQAPTAPLGTNGVRGADGADATTNIANGQANGAHAGRSARETPAASAPQSRQQAALEDEVRNDPLVQELMRVGHVDLAEVLPLDAEPDES